MADQSFTGNGPGRNDSEDRGVPPISGPALVESCMGNAALVTMVLDRFEQQLRGDLDRMERLAVAADWAHLAMASHGLKGAAGAVSAMALHGAATRVEGASHAQDPAGVLAAIAGLRLEIDRCLRFIPELRDEFRGGAGGEGRGHVA